MGTAAASVPVGLSESAAGAARRLPAQVKLVALIGFVCAVVATAPLTVWPYLGHLLVLAVVVGFADLDPVRMVRGLVIELPFVAFAVAMPFLATGERTVVAGLQLSVPGLWGAGTLLAKSSLSVLAGLILAATTSRIQFVAGLQRLRLPSLLVEILSFMVRYLDLIAEQWHRMAIARASRGFRAGDPRAWPALSGALGAGFVRTYERGERVHLAMLARGYTGSLSAVIDGSAKASLRQWAVGAAVILAASAITAAAWAL